jgi:hypothetical protein
MQSSQSLQLNLHNKKDSVVAEENLNLGEQAQEKATRDEIK